jgi:hypothetical protein
MSIDALFQLGIVSVALNTSQTEEHLSRSERRIIDSPRAVSGRLLAGPSAIDAEAPQQRFVLPHVIQTQVYSGRMPV